MTWAIVIGVWVALSIPVALVLGRMIYNGHRNDPRITPDSAERRRKQRMPK